jgi:hypothetical protein
MCLGAWGSRLGGRSATAHPGDRDETGEGTGTGLEVHLGDGLVQLHPTAKEILGPEIAMLSGFGDGRWMVWRPGEDSFEDLA